MVLILAASCRGNSGIKTGLEGNPIPDFDLILQDSVTHFPTSTLVQGQPVVFFDFSPWCPYCRAEMEDIIAHMGSLKNIHFCLVTIFPMKDMQGFYKHYHLERYPNITVGVDYKDYFGHYFKAPGVPYIAVYNREQKLKTSFIGKTDISDIRALALR